VTFLLAVGAVAVILREGYARQEQRRADAEHRAIEAQLQKKAADAAAEKDRATVIAVQAEKRRVEIANEMLQETLEHQQMPPAPGAPPPTPKPIDPSLLRDIEQYVLERIRQ